MPRITERIRETIIITLISLLIFLPRAFLISPYPDPLLHMLLFTFFAGAIGFFVAASRNSSKRCSKLERRMEHKWNNLLHIVNGNADSIIITGADCRIRYMNENMIQEFGDATSSTCRQLLHRIDNPCEKCYMKDVIFKGKMVT